MTESLLALAVGVGCGVLVLAPKRFRSAALLLEDGVQLRFPRTAIAMGTAIGGLAALSMLLLDVPAPGLVLAGSGGSVITTEMAVGRISHALSLLTALAVGAVTFVVLGGDSLLVASAVWAVILACFWLLGVGPLGTDGWLTRLRIQRGKPPLVGGGDPAWMAAVLAGVAAVGTQETGMLRQIVGPDLEYVESSAVTFWASGMALVWAAVTFACLLALALRVAGFLTSGTNRQAIKYGPPLVGGSVIAMCLSGVL